MAFLTNEKLTIVGAAGMIGSNMAQSAQTLLLSDRQESLPLLIAILCMKLLTGPVPVSPRNPCSILSGLENRSATR